MKKLKNIKINLDVSSMKRDLLFDLDDTIVNTNNSRKVVIEKILQNYSHRHFTVDEVSSLLKENVQNDCYDTTQYILKKYNVEVDVKDIIKDFAKIYTEIAETQEHLMISLDVIKKLQEKYNLYIITGRPRELYDIYWNDKLSKYFKAAVCFGDFPDIPRKPAPEVILKTIEKYKLNAEYYIGNSTKDIMAANNAGLKAIFITSTNKDIEEIKKYNPYKILADINDILTIL